MLTPERLREIKERCERATDGPWGVRHRCSGCSPDDDEAAGLGLELVGPPQPLNKGQFARAADAQFCAYAREDVPALVAEVERLWALKDELRKLIEVLREDADDCLATAKEEAEYGDGWQEARWRGWAEGLNDAAKRLEGLLTKLEAKQHAQ